MSHVLAYEASDIFSMAVHSSIGRVQEAANFINSLRKLVNLGEIEFQIESAGTAMMV